MANVFVYLMSFLYKLPFREAYIRMLVWREKHIKQRHFIIILSLLVGIGTSAAAILLKNVIHFVEKLASQFVEIDTANYFYLALPVVGIFIASMFVRYIVKDDISHGITKVLYAISQRKARIKAHNMWTSIVASSFTIGFGGSVGAEAPIVLTGSAIGSNLGRFFHMDQKTLMLMVGCGAAGAVGGIFKAPIAGVVFTLEVLMVDMTMTSIVPLLISSVTATAMSYFFMGDGELFVVTGDFEAFALDRIPFLLALGVICGLVSLYFTKGMDALETFFRNIKNPFTKLFVGGTILSTLIFFLPALYGEGYTTISYLLNDDPQSVMKGSLFFEYRNIFSAIFLYLGLTVVFKIVASSATNGAGGTGGIFAPSLFIGCITGYMVAMGFNYFGFDIPERNFAFAGMSGVLSAVMHAPLTGIFLIAELTGGYSLFMSLMITSTVAYLTIILFQKHSLYAVRLAKRGELLTHNKDKSVLTLMKMESVIDKSYQTIDPDMSLGDLVQAISKSTQSVFPVVENGDVILGIVGVDEIRNIMFRPELYDRFQVRKLMVHPQAYISITDSMEHVMDIFDHSKTWNLPVLNQDGKYIGFVSKSELLNSYRKVLVKLSDD